jgi:hypothetical protein
MNSLETNFAEFLATEITSVSRFILDIGFDSVMAQTSKNRSVKHVSTHVIPGR